jgi:LuxR family maltose regulon positive regulatory protein
MPKRALYRVNWSFERQTYLLSEPTGEEDVTLPGDAAQWLGWLEKHRAFAFDGRGGHLSLLKEWRLRGSHGYWYAYVRRAERKLKRYVGRSEQVTMERLEEIAISLASEKHGTLPSRDHYTRDKYVSPSPPLQFEPLLLSKLALPHLQSELLLREHLLELLDTGLKRKLTMIAGPAGYGKTTLVGQWIASRTARSDALRVAYVTLDTSDNDPIRFWRYVIAACQTFQPGFAKEALELLLASRLPPFKPLEMMLTVLLNELGQLEAPAVLVLDDFHVLRSSPIIEGLSFLLEHLPGAFHLLILLRGDPPLPLARLRARDELLDIYPPHLAFTPEEVRAFFEQTLSFTLRPDTLRQICEHTQGWPTGMRLLSTALTRFDSIKDIDDLLTAFAGSHWSIQDYFRNEVLHALPLSLQTFLLQTSTLPLLSAALCDDILERTDSLQQITTLQAGDLFLLPSGGNGEWSMYHSLFAEAMQPEAHRRLGDTWLRHLAARASLWYEQHGFLAEAIETALNSTEWKRSSNLITQFIEARRQRQVPTVPEWYTLCRWMERLPEDELEHHPDLCLHYAMSLFFIQMEHASGTDEKERIYHLLQVAERCWRETNETTKLAELFSFRALLASQEGRILQAVTWAKQSLAWLPKNNAPWSNLNLTVVGVGELLNGDLNTAQGYLLEALAISERQGNTAYARATRGMLSWLSFERGELHRTAEQFRYMQIEAREQEDRDDIARAQLGLAQVEYQWNHLSEAELAAQDAFMMSTQPQVEEIQARSVIVLAQIDYARGNTLQAQQRLITWLARVQAALTPQSYQCVREVQAALTRLQLVSGDVVAAERWVAHPEHAEKNVPLLQSQREQLLRLRLLLSKGEITPAIAELESLLAATIKTGHIYLGLEVQILLVLAYARKGLDVKAREHLQTLLNVTRNEGYLRLFLDEGEELASLLRTLLLHLREKAVLAQVRHLLQAFAQERGIQESMSESALLPDPLSSQEQKVLRLLVAGNSNREIARELIVSVNTVRTQIQSIYRKLNVNNRVAASATANQLGLL